MPERPQTNAQLLEENHRLRAQNAQLEDRLDHLQAHGRAAKARQEIESLHRDVMSAVADVVFIANDAGRISYVSPNAHFIFGYTADEILKQGRVGFILPGQLYDVDILDKRRELANVPCQIRDAVGRARNLLVTIRRIDAHGGTVMYVARDVTDRLNLELDNEFLRNSFEHRLEEQTRDILETRERFRRMVEGIRDEYLFYSTDANGIITYVSPSVHIILGYDPRDLIGQNWRNTVDTTHEQFPELERLEELRFAGISTPTFRAAVPHADGSERILEFRDCPVRDLSGRVVASEGIGKDVTESLRKDEELRKAKAKLEQHVEERTAKLVAINQELAQITRRYQSVVEDQLEFIVRWRSDGIRTFVNQSYCRHCSLPAEEMTGGDFFAFVCEDDRATLQRELANLSVSNPVVTFEHRAQMPDGRVVWEFWTHRALFEACQLVEYQSVGCDVTERRRREKQAQELTDALAQLNTLSEREKDVMHLVVAGNANKVIARKLALSVKTIEKHRSNLMKKLRVRSVPELVRVAMLIDESAEV